MLEKINGPKDLKKLNPQERQRLIGEMRKAMLERASVHMGHVGPDLGIVEATVALHTVFDSPKDKIVYDVSHQSYPHKMLTGRMQAYTDTSISLASGLAKARDLRGGKENIIAVIGDGSLSGGMAFEGLDTVGELGTNFIVVFNDNDMSIAENHGGMYKGIRKLRETNGQAEDNLFRAFGLDYRFVADGNDVEALIRAFEEVRDIDLWWCTSSPRRARATLRQKSTKRTGTGICPSTWQLARSRSPSRICTVKPLRLSCCSR